MARPSQIRDHLVTIRLSSDNPNPDAVWPALRGAIERLFKAAMGERGYGPEGTVINSVSCLSATRGTPDSAKLQLAVLKQRVEYPLVDATAADLAKLDELVCSFIPEAYEASEGSAFDIIGEWLRDITSGDYMRHCRAMDQLDEDDQPKVLFTSPAQVMHSMCDVTNPCDDECKSTIPGEGTGSGTAG